MKKNERPHKRVCMSLPVELMERVRSVSRSTGISISRLAGQGLGKEVEKWSAFKLLTEGEGEKGK